MADLLSQLTDLRNYYNSGTTKTFQYRKQQLLLLKQTIIKYEQEINEALFADLKKNAEETYATETGLVLAEISVMLKNLKDWMRPKSVATNLVNLPSTSKVYRDPLGVVLIIAPWNYPLQLVLIPLVGAIAGGNCIVLKPSEFAPATDAIVGKIVSEIFPPQYVLYVQGDGAEVVPAMMKNFRFDHVFYTGSIPVGKIVYGMAAEKLVPVTLELGGKSPAIVHADADIKVAAKRIAFGKFLNTGQTCIAPDYVLVEGSIKEKFIEELKNAVEKFYSKAATNYSYGKIVNEKRFDKLLTYFKDGDIIFGGENNRANLFIAPTVLDNVSIDSPVMKEEIFGPILPVLTFTAIVEAINIVQQNASPLAFYLFTGSKKMEEEWMEKVAFGGGCVNNANWHFTNHHLPFGGVGNSGMGSYHGKFTFETFTRLKPVMKTPTWFDPSIKYPPMKGKLKLFKWFIK